VLLVVVDVEAQHVGELRSSVALGAILSIRRSSPRSGLRDLPLETAPPHFSSKAGKRPQVKRRPAWATCWPIPARGRRPCSTPR